jgi:hypothetical protein
MLKFSALLLCALACTADHEPFHANAWQVTTWLIQMSGLTDSDKKEGASNAPHLLNETLFRKI